MTSSNRDGRFKSTTFRQQLEEDMEKNEVASVSIEHPRILAIVSLEQPRAVAPVILENHKTFAPVSLELSSTLAR